MSVDAANPKPTFPWYAIRVRSNYERVVAASLRARGYEDFLPLYRCRHMWSNRHTSVEQPLFPGYVFCRLEVTRRQNVVTTPGVVSILGFGKTPVPVPDIEISAVHRMLDSGLATTPWPYLKVGDRVLIDRGPLSGVEGSLIEIKKSFRLVLSIEMLQRSIAAEIDRSWIRPVSRSQRAF